MTSIITATVFVTAAATQTFAGPTVTVTATATATVAPRVEWLQTTGSVLCYINIALILSSMVVIAVLGTFNRLMAIPPVACSLMVTALTLGWVGWNPNGDYTPGSRRAAVLVSNICFTLNESTVALYSFFLLEKALRGFKRQLFLSVFCTLFLALLALRLSISATVDRYFTAPADGVATSKLINELTQAALAIVTALESWAAFFLIHTFLQAQKTHEAMSGGSYNATAKMWASLARSSELRVSLLCLIAITRLVVFRSIGSPHTLLEIDSFAWTMQQCYPMLLLLDLLASKLLSLKVAVSRVSPVDVHNAGGARAVARVATKGRESEQKSELSAGSGDVLSTTTSNHSGRPSSYGKSNVDVGENPVSA